MGLPHASSSGGQRPGGSGRHQPTIGWMGRGTAPFIVVCASRLEGALPTSPRLSSVPWTSSSSYIIYRTLVIM